VDARARVGVHALNLSLTRAVSLASVFDLGRAVFIARPAAAAHLSIGNRRTHVT
jgi:hypothetical protein